MLCMGDVLWGTWLWFKVNKISPSKGKAVVTQPGAEAIFLKGTAFSQQRLLGWLKFPFSFLKGLYDDMMISHMIIWDMVWKWTFGALHSMTTIRGLAHENALDCLQSEESSLSWYHHPRHCSSLPPRKKKNNNKKNWKLLHFNCIVNLISLSSSGWWGKLYLLCRA